MYQSAARSFPRPAERPPEPGPRPPSDWPPAPVADPPGGLATTAVASAEAAAWDAAATLACRTSVGGETAGADGKAAVVLTLLGLMFAVLTRLGPDLAVAVKGGGVWRAACGALGVGFAAAALAAVVQAFRTISPRFRRDKPSLAFFAEVARLDRDAYADRVEAMSMADAVGQILAYNHAAASICAEKFRQLRRCLRCFEVAAACWFVLAVILAVRSLHG